MDLQTKLLNFLVFNLGFKWDVQLDYKSLLYKRRNITNKSTNYMYIDITYSCLKVKIKGRVEPFTKKRQNADLSLTKNFLVTKKISLEVLSSSHFGRSSCEVLYMKDQITSSHQKLIPYRLGLNLNPFGCQARSIRGSIQLWYLTPRN